MDKEKIQFSLQVDWRYHQINIKEIAEWIIGYTIQGRVSPSEYIPEYIQKIKGMC